MRSPETGLHAQLVQRTPHGITLTAVGRSFLTRVRVAQAELRRAEEEAAGAGGGTATVALGFGPVAAVMLAPPSWSPG